MGGHCDHLQRRTLRSLFGLVEDNNSPQILCDNHIIALSVHCCHRHHDSFPYILLHFVQAPQQLCILCIIHLVRDFKKKVSFKSLSSSSISSSCLVFPPYNSALPLAPFSQVFSEIDYLFQSKYIPPLGPVLHFSPKDQMFPNSVAFIQVCTLSFAEARSRNPPFAFTVCPSPSATSSLSTDSNT